MVYTTNQLNFFRICFITFNLVPEGLRQVFKLEWDFLHKTTLGEWKDTPTNGLDFYNNESRRSRSKNARYLATIQNGNTEDWDCSCLFFAILFSDSFGTTLSAATRKEVNDLRQVRNDIAHISEAELTDAEFKNYVGRVLSAFSNLRLPPNDIDEVKNQKNFPTTEVNNLMAQVVNLQTELQKIRSDLQDAHDTIQRKEEQVDCLTQEINSKVKSFCNLTFKPSHEIIGRSNDVKRIMTKMHDLDHESNGAVSTIYLSGNPGCGKTQIARQIGQEFFTRGSDASEGLTFVATLNAETLETLADSYISLAKQLGITEYSLTNLATTRVNSPKETIQHLQCLTLPKIQQFSKWLIIADNVVNLSLVCCYLPQTACKDWGHGQVLITTQDSSAIPTNVPHTYHESLSVGMQPKDAVELLQRVSQISGNDEQVQRVAEVLEYQPLALAAAAFYMRTVGSCGSPTYGWTNYLETLVGGKREATEEPFAKGNPVYSKTMTSAIKMAIDSTLKDDEVLRQTFLFFSLCGSEPLPVEAAVNFVKVRTSGQTEELIRVKILKSSLITCLYSEDGASDYVRVHNVVYENLRKMSTLDFELTRKLECISVAIQVLHSLTESKHHHLGESGYVYVMLRRITIHCKALYEILTENFTAKDVSESAPYITTEGVISWLCLTAYVCLDLSNPSNAILFSTSACDFVKYVSKTREGDFMKADAFNAHGKALSMICQYESSISYLEEASKIYKAIYGTYYYKVAQTYHNLGTVHYYLCQYHGVKEYHEKALIIQEKIFGDEHADVATCYNNLGIVYRHLGQYSEAKEFYEKSLIIRKKIFGEEHADVATCYNNLGIVYRYLGQYSEAKEYYEKSLIIRKKIFGDEHADVATSYNNLGIVYRHLGQYSEAKEFYEKSLIIRKKIFGEEHADVATCYNNLGIVYRYLGQYSEAKEYYEKSLIIRKKIFGDEHADVATSYNNLGIVYQHLGLYSEAKHCHEKALIIRKHNYHRQRNQSNQTKRKDCALL